MFAPRKSSSRIWPISFFLFEIFHLHFLNFLCRFENWMASLGCFLLLVARLLVLVSFFSLKVNFLTWEVSIRNVCYDVVLFCVLMPELSSEPIHPRKFGVARAPIHAHGAIQSNIGGKPATAYYLNVDKYCWLSHTHAYRKVLLLWRL